LIQSPERLAWLTLWGAFMIFVLILLLSIYSAQWLLFQSVVSLDASIEVGRGTLGLRESTTSNETVIRQSWQFGSSQTITTDEIAQGTIYFSDQAKNDRVVALATILPGSQVRLAYSKSPRFSFGRSNYQILLDEFEGRLEIEIPANLPQSMQFQIESQHGVVSLEDTGVYLLFSRDDIFTIIPLRGEAQFEPFAGDSVVVPQGQTAELFADDQTILVTKTTYELTRNSFFNDSVNLPFPDIWGCSTSEVSPFGEFNLFTFEGRRSIYILRSGELLQNNETGCAQFFGDSQVGLDTSTFDSVRIRATLNVRWHSLAYCGTAASECALMLELTYLNEFGVEQRWIHGFYSFEHTNPNFPLACVSCLIEHDRITPNTWYTYESGNLLDLPENFRPTRLQRLRFYASGHAYEVAIGEVSLLAERR